MNTAVPVTLLYVGDPMCSWCYGFAVPLTQLRAQFPALPVKLMLGGLRAYNTQVMDAALKNKLRQHWGHVAQRSGQPFSDHLFEREDFIYDTEPACRAVVTVRQQAPELALPMYEAIQQAFYAQGRDVTQAAVLAKLWQQVSGPAGQALDFLRTFDSDAARQATRDDFSQVQRWGISGFPTLLVLAQGQAHLLSNGYTEAEVLADRLAPFITAPPTP
ncbi:DsbA family protein [Polaromonas sp. SM01]|uniref:DsbA family protein n=1 Tax=Polaromonas sp. SM01 TaxID=3085630 RepID=UPI002982084A|nr:DsbA family protein [Polaromonas sp. SM01]MDW5443495.1 DsbA family protein [Polaromonas sp. SM01]